MSSSPADSSGTPAAQAGRPGRRRRFVVVATALALMLAGGIISWRMSRGEAVSTATSPRPDYETRLQLGPEQLEALRPVVSIADADMTRIRRELRSQLSATTRELTATIAKELSPERGAGSQSTEAKPARNPAP